MDNAGSRPVDLFQDVEAITPLIPVPPGVPRTMGGDAQRERATFARIKEERFEGGPDKNKAVPDVRTPRLRLQPEYALSTPCPAE